MNKAPIAIAPAMIAGLFAGLFAGYYAGDYRARDRETMTVWAFYSAGCMENRGRVNIVDASTVCDAQAFSAASRYRALRPFGGNRDSEPGASQQIIGQIKATLPFYHGLRLNGELVKDK